MTIDIVVTEKIQAGIDTKLRAIGDAAEYASKQLSGLRKLLNFRSNLGNINTSPIQNAAAATQRWTTANRQLIASNNSLRTSLGGVHTSISNLERTFGLATIRLRGFLATVVLLGQARQAVEFLDTFGTLQNQIRLNTGDNPAKLRAITESVFGIAQEARVPLEGIAKTWRKVDDGVAQYGASVQDSLDVTKTIAQLLTLSGANATEASSSMLQLSQAFSKGKLDGDEFRTTAELMPAVLRELAKSMGVPRSEMFKLSQEGKITGKELLDTFKRIGPQIDAQMKFIPRTIGQALTQLTNQISFSLSKTSQESGFIASIVSGLDLLRNNMEVVAKAAITMGTALGGIATVGIVGWLVSIVNPITLLVLSLTGAVAYFTYFADSILVAGEGSSKLSSYVKILAGDIKDLISNNIKEWFGVFDSNAAQRNFDALKVALKGVVDLYIKLAAVQEATKDAGAKAADTSESGRFAALLQYGKNLVDLFKTGLKSAVQAANEAMRVFFDAMLEKIGKVLGAVRDLQVGFLKLTKSGYGYMGWDTKGISETIKELEKQDYSAKGLQKMFGMDEQSMSKFAEQAAKDFGKAFNAAMAAIKFSNPLNQPGMVNDWLLEQSQRDTYKDSPFFEGFDRLEKKPETLAQTFQDSFLKALERIEKETNDYFDNVDIRAKEAERIAKIMKAKEQFLFEAGGGLDLSAKRPNEFGEQAANAAEKIKQSASSAQSLASYFGDAHKYAEGIQDMMRSVNSSMVDDLAKYQSQILTRQAEQSIRANPDFYKRPESNFNPAWVDKVSGGSSAQEATQQIQEQMQQAIQAGVIAVNAALQGINPSPLAGISAAATQAQQAMQQAMQTAASGVNSALQGINATPVKQALQGVGQGATQMSQQIQQAAQQSQQATQQVNQQGNKAGSEVAKSMQQGAQAATTAIQKVNSSDFSQVTQASQQAGQGLGQSMQQGSQTAQQVVQQMAQSIVAALNQIANAAERAAAALSSVSGGGGSLGGFSSGGYTGNVGVNTPAGIVHGQEYVMPAGPTRKYRNLLEAMRSGRLTTGAVPTGGTSQIGGGSSVNVTVENYGSSKIDVQQISATEIRIIAREEARTESVRSVANALRNPNSRVSKSLGQSTTATRRR